MGVKGCYIDVKGHAIDVIQAEECLSCDKTESARAPLSQLTNKSGALLLSSAEGDNKVEKGAQVYSYI